MNGAFRDDNGKPPIHLIPPDVILRLARVYQYGARKYAPRNWEKGMDWSRVYRAAIAHLFDWWMRTGPDPETGKSHLWHAGCCIMFLVCYELRMVGTDDRPGATAKVDVGFEIGTADIAITATVKTTDRTGVEMEALTAVSVAALTLYDMIKAVDPAARIDDIRVLSKAGGRTGEWTR